MTGLPALIAYLVVETLRNPREAAGRLIALDPPNEARWIGLVLVSVLALIVTRIGLPLIPSEGRPAYIVLLSDPVLGVPMQIMSQLMIAGAVAAVGRVFGGRGSFADTLLLVVWLEFLMVLAQAAQVIVLLTLPPLGLLVGYAALGLFLWLLVQFTAAVHDFTHPGKVALGMIVSFVAIVVILSLVLFMLGITPTIEKG
ncbi:MAG: Yip1 family protein [Albidovulum sp.]|uniref:Yip1 family protein n=1 Tax=Albidovulum sp. TaxID=1872424 RepID=UPI003CBCD25E